MKHCLRFLAMAAVLLSSLSALPDAEETFTQGKRAFNGKSFNFALSRFGIVIDEYPQSPFRSQSYYYSGLSYYYISDFKKATATFNELLKQYPIDPYTARSRYYVCLMLYEQSRYSAAVDQAVSSLKDFPGNEYKGKLQILLGKTYAKLKQYQAALDELAGVKGAYKTDAQYETALIYYGQQKYEQAERNFKNMLIDLENADLLEELLFYKAKSVFFQKRYDDAVFEFNSFLQKYGKGEFADELRFYLSYLPYEKEDYAVCVEHLEGYIKNHPGSRFLSQACYFAGRSQEKLGQIILALSYYNKAADLGASVPYYSESLYRMFLLYKDSKNDSKMLSVLNRMYAGENRQYRETALKELAFFYLEKDLIRSEKYFKELLQDYGREEGVFEYYKWYSYALLKSGNTARANEILNAAYQENPGSGGQPGLLLLLADNYLELEQLEKAREFYSKLLQEFPGAQRGDYAREGIAYIYYLEKEYDRSYQYYQQLKRSGFADIRAAAYFFSAELQRLLGRTAKAATAFKTYVVNFPDDKRNSKARFKLAKLYYDDKSYARAFDEYQATYQAAANRGGRNKALYWMGWSRFQQGDAAAAGKLFQRLYEEDPAGAGGYVWDGLLIAGKLLYNQKRYHEATEAYIKLINNADPAGTAKVLAEAYYELAMSYLQMKDETQCGFYLKKLKELFPAEKTLYMDGSTSLAEYYYTRGSYKKAASIYELLSRTPGTKKKQAEFSYWSGYSHAKAVNKKKAESGYRRCLSFGSSQYYWDAAAELADLLWLQGRRKAALAYYRKIAKNNKRPDLQALAAKRVKSLDGEGEKAKVENAAGLQELTALLPKLKDKDAKALAYLRLGKLSLKSGDEDEAARYFKQATRNSTGASGRKAQVELINYFFSKEDFSAAYNEGMSYYYLYQDYNVKDEKILYMIAFSAFKTGNHSDQRQFYNKLVKLYPDSSYLGKFPQGQ